MMTLNECRIQELEQQLQNSIPKEAVRELVDKCENELSMCYEPMDRLCYMDLKDGIKKLLEGDNNE